MQEKELKRKKTIKEISKFSKMRKRQLKTFPGSQKKVMIK